MAKSIEAFVDNRGNLHLTLTSAVVADLGEVLGRVGDEGGLTEGVARLILSKRVEIERSFAELDNLSRTGPMTIEVTDDDVADVLDIRSGQMKNQK